MIASLDATAGKNEFAAHEGKLRIAAAHQDSRRRDAGVKENKRRGGAGPKRRTLRCDFTMQKLEGIGDDVAVATGQPGAPVGTAPNPCILFAHCRAIKAPLTRGSKVRHSATVRVGQTRL